MKEKKKTGRPEIYDEEFLEEAAAQVLEYAQRDDALTILGFRGETGYTWEQLKEWCDKSVTFSKAYARAKALIGARREQGGLTGKLNPQLVLQRGWQYCGEVHQESRELAKIESSGKVVIEGRQAPLDAVVSSGKPTRNASQKGKPKAKPKAQPKSQPKDQN